jgi:hypothetical protein
LPEVQSHDASYGNGVGAPSLTPILLKPTFAAPLIFISIVLNRGLQARTASGDVLNEKFEK